MADSGITKRALAEALKELLKQQPLSKIRISDICDKCRMNRKSFYYHFKDKYDLVCWIFNTELQSFSEGMDKSIWSALLRMCEYFYLNRSYYRRVFRSNGQNCFKDSFRETCRLSFAERLIGSCDIGVDEDFAADFFADIVVSGIERWIMDNEPLPPDAYIHQLRLCLQMMSSRI